MAKRNSMPVVMNKKELLLPKMEFLPLDESGAGIYVRELGGKSLLKYNEEIKRLQKEIGDEITDEQAIDITIMLVQFTACNSDGTPYFVSLEEVELFAENSLVKLQMISEKAMELSGISGAKNNLPNDLNSSSTDG